MWHLEKNQLITPQQAGFRQHHSTEDQVTYLSQKTEDGFQGKKHTLAVWLDFEKAFDKVWKDGLRVKLRKAGVKGCIFKWISRYLQNRIARVQVNGTRSKKRVIKEGVPQCGVLSPTLFLFFINDIMSDFPMNVGAMYADDLVMFCTEEHLTTARYRLQLALDKLNKWTKQWAVKLNASKTTFSVFSLSPRPPSIQLTFDGCNLPQDESPTYLGVTYDRRLTWKQQIEKAESKAKSRLRLMRKLAGSTWGTNDQTLKKVYTGYIHPVIEYGMTAWCTAAKSHFDRLNIVQNQANRIITGGIKSTPIIEMENATGLHSIDERKENPHTNS